MDFPPHAKKVFQGKIFEVWQWEQKMFDGSTQIFERAKRPDTVEVIATVSDKIILLHQEQPLRDPFFSMPGGAADHGDTLLHEIKRELLEETGYASNDWEFWQTRGGSVARVLYSVHHFIARNCEKLHEPKPDPGEKISLRLITFDEFLALSEEPRFRGLLLSRFLLELRLDSKKRDEFRRLLFRKNSLG